MKHLLIILLSLHSFSFFSQQHPCAFDWIAKMKINQATEYSIQNGTQYLHQQKAFDSIKTIPVVVHIVHLDGTENISDAQVQSQIDILNEDFGKISGTPGEGSGVDTKVRFCLANIDPTGNCTNGIVRIRSTLTNHKTYERPILKELSFWDNERYLNIYVVKTIGGNVLGYSSFPGGPADEDGIVVRHNVFGNIGTASSSMGRTMTHEIGHWLGLYHTFNNGCGSDVCTDGDYVCDTPPVTTANFGCPGTVNSCSIDVPDLPDLTANYMDYTDDNCKNMFTQGQADRISSSLLNFRTAIWSDTNLIITGCDSNYVAPSACGVVANFMTLSPEICIGNSVYFSDLSLNNATSWSWEFPGGTPATSTLQNPTITYDSLGNYDVKLIVSDGITTDSLLISNYIIIENPGVGDPLPYSEDFESGIFPTNGMTLNNSDGGITWELDSIAPYQGNYAIKINNLINTNYGSVDEIFLPYLDFTSIGSTPYMKFVWAYAKSDQLYTDELIVQLSVDCGNTWNQIFYKVHSNLVTGPTQTTPFIPNESQWKNAVINLNAYSNEQYVLLKIINVTDGGNNLYIDNINIGNSSVGIKEGDNLSQSWELFPNPSSTTLTIKSTISISGDLRIIDSFGRVIRTINNNSTSQIVIDISDLSNGIYYIQSIEKGINLSKTFIKQ